MPDQARAPRTHARGSLLDPALPPPPPQASESPAPEPIEQWHTEGSDLLGLDLIRTLTATGSLVKATVVSWLPANESNFFDDNGRPAALYRIRYLDGPIAGDLADLEAYADQFALGAPQVKSCGGPVMAHNTNTKIFLKRAGRGRKKAVLQHSPFMPYGDCEFSITAAGVVDAVDG